jgi:hypothetical protein
MNHKILASLAFLLSGAVTGFTGTPTHESLHVIEPITHGNLTIFPIVGGTDYDTSHILTLDEGTKAGTVIVTEQGSLRGLVRRPQQASRGSGAQVNQLVLVNNSDRPLLLLAGEIVTGGKQDRIIGVDRLVPPKSDPIDLSVFCVEPGRWTGRSDQFASMHSQMAQPSVRVPAMAAKNQQQVWDRVASSRSTVEVTAAAPPVSADSADLSTSYAQASGGNDLSHATRSTTSYAATMAIPQVKAKIDSVAGNYDAVLQQLRKSGAKGVVVAINGELVWADLFASNDLLLRYWQKLVRSYAAESLTTVGTQKHVTEKDAEAFLDRMSGNREVIETDPGVFRRAEITGDNYKVFTLTELMTKTEFNVHTAKMLYDKEARLEFPRYDVVR